MGYADGSRFPSLNGRIFIKTDKGQTLSRPLEAFQTLKDACEKDRYDLHIGRFGDDIHWDALDEDLHINSFYETTEPSALLFVL